MKELADLLEEDLTPVEAPTPGVGTAATHRCRLSVYP
jgi:hypothetical protein